MTARVARCERKEGAAGRIFECLSLQDESVGLRAWLVLEDAPGPWGSFGGLRRCTYASPDAAQDDAWGLAQQMSHKLRFAGLNAGGAKAVIMDHADLDLEGAYESIGDVIAGLEGRWTVGPDLGTGESELGLLRSRTRHVNHIDNDAGDATARGVYHAVMAYFERNDEVERTARIEGLGSVGAALAGLLAEEGFALDLYDANSDVQSRLSPSLAEHGGKAIESDDRVSSLFSPCAVGATIDASALKTRGRFLVCGSANRQLASALRGKIPEDAIVTYAPDFVVNAGAVIQGVLVAQGRREEVPAALLAIGSRFGSLLDASLKTGSTPLSVVEEMLELRS